MGNGLEVPIAGKNLKQHDTFNLRANVSFLNKNYVIGSH